MMSPITNNPTSTTDSAMDLFRLPPSTLNNFDEASSEGATVSQPTSPTFLPSQLGSDAFV